MIGTILTLIGLGSLNIYTTAASYLVNFFVFWNIGKKMHKNPVSTAILGTLFPGIMIPIIGLSKNYQYDPTVKVSPNGPIGDEINANNTNTV